MGLGWVGEFSIGCYGLGARGWCMVRKSVSTN